MKFFIPSYKRSNIIEKHTLKCLDFVEKSDIYVFVNKEEENLYKEKIGDKATIIGCDLLKNNGIVGIRKIMQQCGHEQGIKNFFMFDDDLGTFQTQDRISENGKFHFLKNVEGENKIKMLKEMEKYCIDNKKVFAGLCPRRMGWKLTKEDFFKSLPYGFEWVNNNWYIENNAYIPESLFRFEDIWMALKVVEMTKKTDAIGTYFPLVANPKGSNTKGGCSEYMYKDILKNKKAFDEYPKYFPTLRLKPKMRYYKNGWINWSYSIDWKNPIKKPEEPNRNMGIYGQKYKDDYNGPNIEENKIKKLKDYLKG